MPIGTGVAKSLRYKAEVTWGVAPGTGGAQVLRRVTSDLALKKQTYESAELLSSYQRRDFRHGTRSVEGSIAGELSSGTWKDLVAAAVRRVFTTVAAITGASFTVAGAGPTFTITRAAGSFLTDGIKIGQVVRITAGAFNAANLNKNLVVLAIGSATVITVQPLNGVALVAEGPIAAATLTIPGKVSFVPQTGHTDPSFAFEHWHSDLALSERFDGCKINEQAVTIPPNGIATISNTIMGKDIAVAGAQYYIAPAAETTTGLLSSATGLLVVQGAAVAILTGLNFSLKGNMTAEPVLGSTTYPDITEGRILVDGQFTALFDSATLRDIFLNETEATLIAVLGASPLAAADFMSFSFPRVKFGDAAKDDGDKAVVQTVPFTALENTAGGAGVSTEATTYYVQDSQA